MYFMDGGLVFWLSHLGFKHVFICLNNLHSSIKFTFENAKNIG